MEPMRVELSGLAKRLIVVGSLATFGVLALFMWWTIRYRYPLILDREGVTTRAGTRHLWADVKEALTVRQGSSRGLRLSFASGGRILIAPRMLRDPEQALAYVERCGIESSSWR